MTEQRERIADAAEAWARAAQNYEDAANRNSRHPDEDFANMMNAARRLEYARQNLLQACGKVGA
jgi:hypothetical protein